MARRVEAAAGSAGLTPAPTPPAPPPAVEDARPASSGSSRSAASKDGDLEVARPRKRSLSPTGRSPAREVKPKIASVESLLTVPAPSPRPRALSASDLPARATKPLPAPSAPPARRPSTEAAPAGPAHLLLVDADDQLVHAGPSSSLPLFARLGLVSTIQVSEHGEDGAAEADGDFFTWHANRSVPLVAPLDDKVDYLDLLLDVCDSERMYALIALHLNSPIFFPLLHGPSFLAEFAAVTRRRLLCTPQYGAFLMSILAATARLVPAAKDLLPAEERGDPGRQYYEFALYLMRISGSKLDIRYILALYRRELSAGVASSYVGEAISLAYAAGLHKSYEGFDLDSITTQIRIRLFWGLYILDTSLAYAHGRPSLIKLSDCTIDLPAVEAVKRTEVVDQQERERAVSLAANIKMLDVVIVLGQVLPMINSVKQPKRSYHDDGSAPLSRSELFGRTAHRLDKIEAGLPAFLKIEKDKEPIGPKFLVLQGLRVNAAITFARVLIAREALVAELDAPAPPTPDVQVHLEPPPVISPTHAQPRTPGKSLATRAAVRLSLSLLQIYTHYRRQGLLQHADYTAVTHLTAAAHTLLSGMVRSADVLHDHRADLVSIVELLGALSARFPVAEAEARLIAEVGRRLDSGGKEVRGLALRMLARTDTAKVAPPAVTVSKPPGATVPLPPLEAHPEFTRRESGESNASNESVLSFASATSDGRRDERGRRDSHSAPRREFPRAHSHERTPSHEYRDERGHARTASRDDHGHGHTRHTSREALFIGGLPVPRVQVSPTKQTHEYYDDERRDAAYQESHERGGAHWPRRPPQPLEQRAL
ncbi:hypothetical protein Q8F55_008440 [Vanrija albida]|uniref:Xylanolytic transcriptional activator regulatory domain-containing protein n=1 Tax=Vanrija albida TaxID=181172 RepID=A0ABR3PQV2_9TREE